MTLGFFRRTDGRYEAHIHAATGLNIHSLKSSGHIKLKSDFIRRNDGGYFLQMGPTLYWRFSDLWHGQLSYKRTVLVEGYEMRSSLRSGIAVVF